VTERVFLALPPEAREWAQQHGIPQPPTSNLQSLISNPQLQITSPDPNTVYQISPRLPRTSQQIPLRAIAGVPLTSVTFVLDGQPLGAVTEAPFEWWWVLEPGAHTLVAEGRLANEESVASEAVQFVVKP
jgi:hypothetical protein